MRLLVDLGTFEAEHRGGKDEVAYNLLRGFSALGLTESVLCVCREELEGIVKSIDPRYRVIALERYHRKGKLDAARAIREHIRYGRALRGIVARNHCDCVLFTNKMAPPVRMGVPTVFLPHDVQAASRIMRNRDVTPWWLVEAASTWINLMQSDRAIAISDFDKKEILACFPRQARKIVRIYDPIRFREAAEKSSPSISPPSTYSMITRT